MKIKLTKKGRNVLGGLGWALVIVAVFFSVMFMLDLATSSQLRASKEFDPHSICKNDTVLQPDGSCTNQEN